MKHNLIIIGKSLASIAIIGLLGSGLWFVGIEPNIGIYSDTVFKIGAISEFAVCVIVGLLLIIPIWSKDARDRLNNSDLFKGG